MFPPGFNPFQMAGYGTPGQAPKYGNGPVQPGPWGRPQVNRQGLGWNPQNPQNPQGQQPQSPFRLNNYAGGFGGQQPQGQMQQGRTPGQMPPGMGVDNFMTQRLQQSQGNQPPPMQPGQQMSPTAAGLSQGPSQSDQGYNPWAGISSINPQSDGSKFYPGYAGPGPQYDPNQQSGMPAGQYLQQRVQQGGAMGSSGPLGSQMSFNASGGLNGQRAGLAQNNGSTGGPWQPLPPQSGMANPFGAQAVIPQFNQQGQQGNQISQTGVFSNASYNGIPHP